LDPVTTAFWLGVITLSILRRTMDRSLKVAVQGPELMDHPLYIYSCFLIHIMYNLVGEIFIFSVIISQDLLISISARKFSKATNLLEISTLYGSLRPRHSSGG
jgi:hypothetical protein